MIEQHLTLVIPYNNSRILLGMKKRGFGEGRWNGFGGKVEAGESYKEAARREIFEEAGIIIPNLVNRGTLRFTFENEEHIFVVHLFSSNEWEGEPKESDEMKPQWFGFSEIPFADMWPDDKYWLPHLLAGKNINGEFHFRGHDIILKHKLLLN
jgi:8-oxo-dGTP diphosphatase / 2-hydroxy-dATP diphosphatase